MLEIATQISLFLISAAILLGVVRLVLGPSLSDRVMVLDFLGVQAIGMMAVLSITSGEAEYVDVAMAVGLVGFLGMLALSTYVYGEKRR